MVGEPRCVKQAWARIRSPIGTDERGAWTHAVIAASYVSPRTGPGCSVPSIGSGSWPLTWHLLEGTGQLRTSAHHSHRVGRCAFGTATAKPGPSYTLLTHPMLIGVARNGVDKYGCQAWAKRPKGDSSRPDAET